METIFFNREYNYFVETKDVETLHKWTKCLANDFKDIIYYIDYTNEDNLFYQIIISSKWDCGQQLKKALNTEVFLYFSHH